MPAILHLRRWSATRLELDLLERLALRAERPAARRELIHSENIGHDVGVLLPAQRSRPVCRHGDANILEEFIELVKLFLKPRRRGKLVLLRPPLGGERIRPFLQLG